MQQDEGKRVGIEGLALRGYFSVIDDKPNMTAVPEAKTWYRLISVLLGNGPNGRAGDSVGVVTAWQWPDALEGVDGETFERVAAEIRKGEWREDAQAKAWIGKPIAKVLGLDLDSKADKAWLSELVKLWIKAGSLVEVPGLDGSRRERNFVKVAEDEAD